MDYQVKHVINYWLRQFLFAMSVLLTVAVILWLCFFVTDYVRYRRGEMPLFVITTIKTGTMEEYTIKHECVLYTIVEKYYEGILEQKMYLFKLEIK